MDSCKEGTEQTHYTLANRLEGDTVLREDVWLIVAKSWKTRKTYPKTSRFSQEFL